MGTKRGYDKLDDAVKLTILLPERLLKTCKRQAAADSRSLSNWVRLALEGACKPRLGLGRR